MNPLTYGGDEVSALVLDFGTQNTRAGYAGEEIPRCVVPTAYGYMDVEVEVPVGTTNISSAVEDVAMNGNGSTADEAQKESLENLTSTEAQEEKAQDQGRQETADKIDGMEGIEEQSKSGQDDNGEKAEAPEEAETGVPVEAEDDTRLPPSERQRERSPANGRTGTASSKQPQPTMKKVRQKRFYVGEEGVNVWREGMEVGNMMTDGIITEAEPLPHLLSHILHEKLGVDPSEHPLMVTEPAWNTPRARETLAEIAFEGEGVPAFYVACNAVLSAFSAGKSTALIVDIGQDLVSVVPVCEGYAIRAGTMRQPLGMTFLESQIEATLRQSNPNITFTPHHFVKGRTPVALDQPAQVVLNQQRFDRSTASWKSYAEQRVVQDWKESICEVSPFPYDPQTSANRQSKFFEFPDGYNHYYGNERYQLPELLFKPETFVNKAIPVPSRLSSTPDSETSHSLSHIVGLADLVHNSIFALDVDQRAALLQNIVVIGGGSFMPGLTDRLNFELAQRIPGSKIKIHSPGNSIERKYSAWLGGSILASLGTFHQLWVGQDEWKEHGANILRQRKWSNIAQTREDPPARQRTHETAASSIRNVSSSVFKTPALPDRCKPTVQPSMNGGQTRRVNILQRDSERPTTNEHSPNPETAYADSISQASNVNAHLLETRPHNVRAEPEDTALVPTSVRQEIQQESTAKELGYQNEDELELHRRVNRHVNAYLKKVCGIAGGVKLHTERQAWTILSGLTPLDITTDPEVFEPIETDQLAKFLNPRRKILEDFQQSKMPMPALPLLPPSSSREPKTDSQGENANLSLEWGLQGIVNRDRWTITQSDLAIIKAEVSLLQKISRLSTFLPPMTLQLESPEMIDVTLSRVAIRNTTRYAHHTRQNQDPSAQESPLRILQPFRNSIQHFREVISLYKSTHIGESPAEIGTFLGTAVKMKDVCDMSLSINQNEIKIIKEELQKVVGGKQYNAKHRLKSLVLTPEWEKSCVQVSIKLDCDGKRQSIASTPEPCTGMQRMLGLVEPLSPTSSTQRYMPNSDDTPTLAVSTSSLEEYSSLPGSPIQQTTRNRQKFYHSALQYPWPAMTALEAEKMEVPLLPKHQIAPHDSSIFDQHFPTPFTDPAAIPISSSPDERVQAIAGTTEEQAEGEPRISFSRLPDKGKKSRSLALTPPGLLNAVPECDINSNYMKGSSSGTSSVAIAPLKRDAQECLLKPPLPATDIEYAIYPIEQYLSFRTNSFAVDQLSSVPPSDPLLSPFAHMKTTNSNGVPDDFTVFQKKQRSSMEYQSTVAHDAVEDKAGKQAQLKLYISETGKQRPSESYDMDLDRIVCEMNQGDTGSPVEQQILAIPPSRISRYLLTRETTSHRHVNMDSSLSSFGFQNKQRPNDRDNQNATLFRNEMTARKSPVECEVPALDDRPANPPDISLGVERAIRSAETSPVLPIMVNTNMYNKRDLCSALHRLHIQPYGHDHLEADIILNLKTACILMPLASLVSNSEELVQRLVTLAHSFENFIVIFDLYPAKRITTSQVALPDPWNPSTRATFNQFKGRLKRQILWKVSKNSGFDHRVNVYLSDNANTLAALLRIHVDLESMPVGTSVYRHSDDIGIEDSYAWLSVDMGPEENQIRDGLQLNSAAALYIALEYGLSAFLEVCKSRNNNIELLQLLGVWNMDTTREIVQSRAAEAMILEGEGSVDGSQSLVADGSLTIPPEDQNHSWMAKAGSRQILNTPPISFASNDDSYGTDFEAKIVPDWSLQGEEAYYGLGTGPAYFFEDSSPGVIPLTACEELDELSLNHFEWN
ncbi:hypothetical protein QFC19_000655 [Naganishia cerealis]|uniref:Uncharacterized protein n=1 Tax=Naganishia cerealis TaxID=610337 RepID=A0ACC2WN87_9TREE|nr:hypothetical protein QFC19_000655 [Naganishia cerealis]